MKKTVVGKNVEQLLKKHHLKKKDLAQKIQCSPNTISNIIRGKSPYFHPILEKISRSFGVPVLDLFVSDFDLFLTARSGPEKEFLQKLRQINNKDLYTLLTTIVDAFMDRSIPNVHSP